VDMLSEGFTTRRGRKGAYIFHDVVQKQLRPRKGARLTAIINGGAIPDNFDCDVIKEPENIFVGTLNEDFAIESAPGDVFQLGNTSYRVLRVETGKVKVEDAHGLPPSVPFWLGEAPGRTSELSFAVSRLREELSIRLKELEAHEIQEESGIEWKKEAMNWLLNDVGISEAAADQLIIYLALTKVAMGVIPSQDKLVLERFFDEAGDMHLVIHSPFGSRINRAWGLSIRKRFCKKFNFELQAAATEDAIILSLGSTHSFPLEEVFGYLKSASVREVLIQALLDSPMFEIRWRWNASCALAVIRRRAGQRVPPQLQRMQSEDLVALVFPDQLACFENIQGEREVPQHPLVEQTIHDCLTEAMDIDGFISVLKKIENKEVELIAKDLREPSPIAQEVLTARPYAFLDDAPLEERRTRAVMSRRWINPAEANDLGKLDPNAIELVKSEAWPDASSADELQDALNLLGYITEEEGLKGDGRFAWTVFMKELMDAGRATILTLSSNKKIWIAVERLTQFEMVYSSLVLQPEIVVPERLRERSYTKESALREIVRGRMEGLGPVTESQLSGQLALPQGDVQFALLALEQEGFIFRGSFSGVSDETEWCERRLLARIHRYTLQKLRREIEPVSPSDFMRFLIDWQGLDPEHQAEGPLAVENIISKLEGFEASSASWEGSLLPSRIKNYDHTWLDACCMSGKVVWGRFSPGESLKLNSPIKTTPLMLVQRRNADLWKSFQDRNIPPELSANAAAVLEHLKTKGASFFDDIIRATRLFDSKAEEAIAELVSLGLVTSDSFNGLRALLVPAKYKLASNTRKQAPFTMDQAGRWSISTSESADGISKENQLEFLAKVLLKRYGVVCRKLAENESISVPWRELAKVYRTMEARGEIRGGRFVDGVWGEQFALPESITRLREIRKKPLTGQTISLSASDPLNLIGVITPGKRLAAYYGNRLLLQDGVPIAIYESGEVKFLLEFEKAEKWRLQDLLIRKPIPPQLKGYLG